MGRIWSTLGLLLVLGGLGAYIYFVDSKSEPSDSAAKEKVFGTLTADDIEEVEVKSAEGDRSRLQKADGKWQLVEPVKTSADESEATSIATSLASLEISRVVDESAANLSDYGLQPARLELAFRKKGEKELQRIAIGEKTPTGSDLYARSLTSNRVFLIPAYLEGTFNKSTFLLRDRRILVFDQNAVTGLELSGGSVKASLAKSGSEWRLTSPLSARADFAAVEGALGRLSSTQMQGIVDPEGQNLPKYGLDKPSGTIAVATGSAKATLTLGSTDNALLFAKDSSRPIVFTVAPVLKDDVIRSVADLRRKDLFDSRAFTTNRIEITRGAETKVFEKSKGKDDADVWRSGSTDVDAAKTEDLLTKLTGLRAERFEDRRHPSLETPALVVTVTFDDKKQETVSFARSGSDVYAFRSDEPGSATVMASGLDDVMKAIDEVK